VTALETARDIADAVLFEGYLLYPYRANDAKNQVRWQFGVLAPPTFVDIDASEHSWLQTECVLEGRDVELAVQVRFLQVQRRRVERWDGAAFERVDSLDVADATYLPCDEAIVVERIADVVLPGFGGASSRVAISAAGGEECEILTEPDRTTAGRLVRRREPLDAVLTVDAVPLPGPFGVRRLRLRLENCTPWTPSGSGSPQRPEALRRALVAAHLLVASTHGSFVSQIDPPEWARGYVEGCEQVGCFPVLAGLPGTRDLVLASPIILYDHPQVAPESEAQFCDATEMDEMLTLRTLTLTDAEKRLVRGSDPKAAALVDHVDHLPPELLDRLHGAIRSMSSVARPAAPVVEPLPPWWDAAQDATVDPDTDFVLIGDVAVGRGSSVVLRPGGRSTDAQDMFLEGRAATVEAVIFDVDGGTHLAVSLDDLVDDGYHPHGRFLYFAPDEVEPIRVSA
jgi:hypothetical protein